MLKYLGIIDFRLLYSTFFKYHIGKRIGKQTFGLYVRLYPLINLFFWQNKRHIYDYGDSDEIVKEISELPSKNMACNNKMDMEILDSRNRFGVLVDYDAGVYERSTAEAFAGLFTKACSELINVTDHTVSVRDLSI